MIVKENGFNPLIIFDNYHLQQPDENGIIPMVYMHTCSSVRITKKHIPKNFYVEEILQECIMVGMQPDYQKPKGLEYIIKLKDSISLRFTDKTTANLYFKILCSDFENVNIEEQHPELFL